jgi:hypothetical protein
MAAPWRRHLALTLDALLLLLLLLLLLMLLLLLLLLVCQDHAGMLWRLDAAQRSIYCKRCRPFTALCRYTRRA